MIDEKSAGALLATYQDSLRKTLDAMRFVYKASLETVPDMEESARLDVVCGFLEREALADLSQRHEPLPEELKALTRNIIAQARTVFENQSAMQDVAGSA